MTEILQNFWQSWQLHTQSLSLRTYLIIHMPNKMTDYVAACKCECECVCVCVCVCLCMNRADKQDKCAVCEIYKAVCLITTCTCHKTYTKWEMLPSQQPSMRGGRTSHCQLEIPPPLPPFACPVDILTATAYSYRLLLSLLWFIQFML